MLITLFTPTYDRVNTLSRIYQSLLNQNFLDFEWLIVDDGSTDNTEIFIHDIINESPFEIRYYKTTHQGKHRAYNLALKLAKGQLFFVLDSDDWLPDNALITIKLYSGAIFNSDSIGYILALKQKRDGSIIGNRFPSHEIETKLHNLEYINCRGERSFIFKTEVARKFSFPDIEGEMFVTENVVYDQIDHHWNALILDIPLTICEYQPQGLSSNIYNLMWNNPTGYIIYYYGRINNATSLNQCVGYALRYHAFIRISNVNCPWKNYKGKYRSVVKVLSFTGLFGKIYYKLKCKYATSAFGSHPNL